MAKRSKEGQNNSTYNIFFSVLESNYSKNIYAVPVSDSMKFIELKNYIKSKFETKSFDIFFVEMFLNSIDQKIDNKTLDYFLFKEGSVLNLIRNDIEYKIDYVNGRPVGLTPPKLERCIGSHKWSEAHELSYLLDKPVKVQHGMGYTYIITPNGKRYSGPSGNTFEEFYNDGYYLESLATREEIMSMVGKGDNFYHYSY